MGGIEVREQGELLILHRFKDGKSLFAVVNPTFEDRLLTFRRARAARDLKTEKTLKSGDVVTVGALDYLLLESI